MARFGTRPPDQFTKFDSTIGTQWASQLTAFVQGVAKLPDDQTFGGKNRFANSAIPNLSGNFLLAPGGFDYVVNIEKTSRNAVGPIGPGGNAALYIQHVIDNSVCAIANANIGIRVQVLTSQQSTSSAVNDVVGSYIGVKSFGVSSVSVPHGVFGYHADIYYNATGINSAGFGSNVELFRGTPDGVTFGYHVRSNSGAGLLQNNYAFAASPSVGGSNGFNSAFTAGTAETGTLTIGFGLDLRFANVISAGAYFLDNVPMVWGDNIVSHTRRIVGNSVGRIELDFNATRIFSVSDGGIIEVSNAGVKPTSGASSGKFLQITDTAGNIWKIALNLN